MVSIDTLRGFDMFMLMWGTNFFGVLFRAIYPPLGEILTVQFEHVAWNGFHFYDLIFALFLFISGISIPFSITKRLERGDNRLELWKHIFKRGILLFLIGFLINNLNNLGSPEDWRLMGVLQRFAICNLFASILVMNVKPKAQLLAAAGILLGYWALMTLVPVPGFSAGDFTPAGNLAGYIDRLLLPNPNAWCCYTFGDSEGLLTTVPAVATCLFGVTTGHWLRIENRPPVQKCVGLLVSGSICIGIALIWNLIFPINKYLWTSSFVMLTGGISILLVGIFYGIIDIAGFKRWTIIFTVVGLNSILIYALHDFIGVILLFALFGWIKKNQAYKKLGFWILTLVLLGFTAFILLVPGILDYIITTVGIIDETPLFGQTLFLVYGYSCLVFCYKKKWFLKI
jgi:predicted acyltransferase